MTARVSSVVYPCPLACPVALSPATRPVTSSGPARAGSGSVLTRSRPLEPLSALFTVCRGEPPAPRTPSWPRGGLTVPQELAPVLLDATANVKGRLWNVCRASPEQFASPDTGLCAFIYFRIWTLHMNVSQPRTLPLRPGAQCPLYVY